ncbi:spermatogenesis-associated protein 24-like isoform X1 [Acipenser oxyrinchus oxyrinchus]|uniref:Spermatogenesis-associated protein 24-like isoform X1 n=1 Tax=Acipenser oxyrinchus oxyrinchus TaxID=40147 RepID=A0AAD8CZB7_ACIOX|nr:spermatogenesis-associated protein 24-like isoform X1 [Acipenser oxyrinchus oxyrinchus]
MLEDEVQVNNLVYNQLRDLIQTQQRVLATIRETMITKERELIPKEQYEEVVNDLENERLQHAKTQALLNQESEKLQFALGEIDILTNQMQREKKSFEKVLASIKNKALKESTKNDKLKSKCNEMESTVQKHEDILIKKENQIKQLHNQLAKHKTTLKLQMTDVEIQRKQEAYIAEALQKKQRTAGHWTSGSSSYDTAV